MRLPMLAQPGRTGESRSKTEVEKCAWGPARKDQNVGAGARSTSPWVPEDSDWSAICKSLNFDVNEGEVSGVDGTGRGGARRRTQRNECVG